MPNTVRLHNRDDGTIVGIDENGNEVPVEFDEVDLNSLHTGSLHTKTAGSGRHHYISEYDGATPDDRLDNALSAADTDDVIWLGDSVYNRDRTFSARLTIYGDFPVFKNQLGNATWTFNSAVNLIRLGCNETEAEIRIEGGTSKILHCSGLSSTSIVLDNSRILVLGCHFFTVTVNSGATGCLIDSCIGTSVTDNDGSAVIGDIS